MTAERSTRLLLVLAGFFICNALIAEFVGVKIFAMEDTLGLRPFNWQLYGRSGSLNFTAGVLLWPIVVIMTDVINEYFGRRGVRALSYITVGLIVYAFLFAYLAIGLTPTGWWVAAAQEHGVPDLQAAFAYVFGQGMWTIAGSLVAFLIGQLIDVSFYSASANAQASASSGCAPPARRQYPSWSTVLWCCTSRSSSVRNNGRPTCSSRSEP